MFRKICSLVALATLAIPAAVEAQNLISNKRMDSVFFGLVKPGIAKPRSTNDYIQGANCAARSEIFSKDFNGSGHLKIPAATRKLRPMTITCAYNGKTRKFTIQSEPVFLANPAHRAIILRGSRMKDEAKRSAFIANAQSKLKYWGYGNSIIVNF